jgi:threonine dehydratase
MAGQGTIAQEMLDDDPDLDVLIIPLGGGGLMAGNAVAAKALKPEIELIGVEAALYPSFFNAVNAEDMAIGGATLAEGIAVKTVGVQTLPIVSSLVSDIVLVGEDLIERAVNAYACLQHTLAEGAGAAGLAAMLKEPQRYAGRKVGLVLCGGNIDTRLLAAMLQRHLARVGQLVRFRVTTLDNAGFLGTVATIIGQCGGNIQEVLHDRIFGDASARSASIVFTVELPDRERASVVLAALHAAGFEARGIENNAADIVRFSEVA